ncbi:MAG: DUF6458 family protein [Dehalococcoidia bacterium]
MALGSSLLLLALGAILAFGVTVRVSGLDLAIIGRVLMAVGGLGLIISLISLSSVGTVFYRDRHGRVVDGEVREVID